VIDGILWASGSLLAILVRPMALPHQSRLADFGLPALSPDTAKRIAFTLGALVIWRLGCFVPLPGVSLDVFAQLLRAQPGSSPFVSEAVARVSVFSLGVWPYVASYVLLHVLCAFSERLRDLRRAGPSGWQRFSHLIRFGALLIAVYQGYGIAVGIEAVPNVTSHPGFFFRTGVVVSLVAGTMFLIWLGEQISLRGVGSGVWLIFAASYVAGVPAAIYDINNLFALGILSGRALALCIALAVGLIALIVFVEGAERRLPVEYADRSTVATPFLSLKIDNTGVLAPLLASAVILVPATLAGALEPEGAGWATNVARALARGTPFFIAYAALIVLFTLFLTAALIDSRQLVQELGHSGGNLVGAAEGGAEFVDGVLARLTLIGALYLVVLCVVPEILVSYAAVPFYLGGVPLLVTTLVAFGVLADVAAPPQRRAGSPKRRP
jgi:preprotein translocase subunit SecY